MLFNRFPKRTGIYHIKDNIELLELRIYFRKVNSLLRLPKFDYNQVINGKWHGRHYDSFKENMDADESEVKVVNIKWQEKLFSAAEEELYKEQKNCITEIQKNYHAWLLEKSAATAVEGGSGRGRKKRTKKQQKNVQLKQNNDMNSNLIHTYVHEDNFHEKESTKTITDTVEHMFIYASVDVDTELVHLKWFPDLHILQIYPDLNSFKQNPYFIEIDKDFRHLYAYAVENISKARSENPGGDLSLYLQLPECQELPHWRSEERLSTLFSMPPKRTKRISFLFEITDGCHFKNDNIHIRYHIELPKNTIHEEGHLTASTHTSCRSENGYHNFGYNWQLTLLCEEDFNDSDFLHIYFEVISIDYWERERVEGYAHLAICLVDGHSLKYQLHCLQPALSFWSKLEQFFIGGRRKFDFKRFFKDANPNLQSENDSCDDDDISTGFHSRYGALMQSNGSFNVTCQRFWQRNCEILDPCPNSRSGMTLEDIMHAYRMARKRLEAVALS